MYNWLETYFFPRKYFLLIGCTLTLLLHFPFLNRPPESQHVWRQCNTLAVARNFYEEEMNIFRPRVDQRYGTDGVTGMQFPAYEFIVAGIYQLTGEQFWIHRMLSLLFLIIGAYGIYEIVFQLTLKKAAAAVAGWAWLWSPEMYYHGINALPDIAALSCSVIGLAFFLKWQRIAFSQNTAYNKPTLLAFSLAWVTMCGLIKLQYLAIGFFIAGWLVSRMGNLLKGQSPVSKSQLAGLLFGYAAIAVIIPLLWYGYAIDLISRTGLMDFGLEIRPVKTVREGLEILNGNMLSDIPELLLGYGSFLLLVLGFVGFWGEKYGKKGRMGATWLLPLGFWAVGLIAYHVLELSQMKAHQYYMLPHLPLLLIVVGVGGYWLFHRKRGALLLSLILVSLPCLAMLRILPSRWLNPNKQVPLELYEPDSRLRLASSVADDAYCVVGPDDSSCIFFYFLHKKGGGFGHNKNLTDTCLISGHTHNIMEEYLSQGAKFLYYYGKDPGETESIKPYLKGLVLREGQFWVYRLE